MSPIGGGPGRSRHRLKFDFKIRLLQGGKDKLTEQHMGRLRLLRPGGDQIAPRELPGCMALPLSGKRRAKCQEIEVPPHAPPPRPPSGHRLVTVANPPPQHRT